MRTALTFVFLLVFVAGFAQTRRIEHRAHSGKGSARYVSTDGSYGRVAPRKVKVHLESGRDTMVYTWDSLARPQYNIYADTMPRAQFGPRNVEPKTDIREMGMVTGRVIIKE
jgi:hypothetical protein